MNEPIVLPFPPSVNGTFRQHNGSRLSKRYIAWRDAATVELLRQRPTKHCGRVALTLEFAAPDRRPRDIDNLLKAPLDLLVKQGIIEDDNIKVVREVTARWVENGPPCSITIRSAA